MKILNAQTFAGMLHSGAAMLGENKEDINTLNEKIRKKYGIVSVAAGEGIKESFRSLGCDAVVDGGQSMNPSAGDFSQYGQYRKRKGPSQCRRPADSLCGGDWGQCNAAPVHHYPYRCS